MRIKKTIIAVSTFVVLVVSWELLARVGAYNTFLLPPPTESITAIIGLWHEGVLQSDLLSSMQRYLPGFFIGGSIGIIAGVITGISKNIQASVNPLFHYLRSIPPVALIPFILVLFGIGDIGKVSLVAWACFFPVWLSTQAGVKQVPKEYIWAADIFDVKGIRRVIDVWIPFSLPYILSGLRISVATGLFALAAAEMFAASSGIGFRIVYSHQLFQTDTMVGMILLLGVIALIMDQLLYLLVKMVARWESE